MMSGNTFVIGEGLHEEFRLFLHIFQIDVIGAGTRPIQRGRIIKGAKGRVFAKGFNAFDNHISFGLGDEKRVELNAHFVNHSGGFGHIGIAAFVRIGEGKLRVRAQECEELFQATVKSNTGHNFLHLALDARDFFEANLMNFIRCQLCRRIML